MKVVDMRVALVSDWYYPKIGGVAAHMHNLAIKLRNIWAKVLRRAQRISKGL
ncbi:MAG: hypothetical protein PWQ92_1499 [Thermococcaceae archaeon]|nr:hypothetical protein [Thermococcaceae archaeon]